MSAGPSDTTLIGRLKAGTDADAAQRLWQRYSQQLLGLARDRLRRGPRRVADEEDVVLNAFDSFFRGAAEGRFSRLNDRDDLWQLLVMLAERKAIDQVRREKAARRGGGQVRGDSHFAGAGFDEVAAAEPTPEFAALFAEQSERLLALLGDPELRQVALCKLAGHTNQEIAEALGRVERSVERKLQTIRKIWEKASDA